MLFFAFYSVSVSAQLPSCFWRFAIPWTAARQASLSITISWNLIKFMSIELVMLISSLVTLFFSCPQSFPGFWSFSMSQLFASGTKIGASPSASVPPMNVQVWFLSGLTGLISLQSKGLSRGFSSTTVRKHQFFNAQPSLWSNSLSIPNEYNGGPGIKGS